MAKFNWYHNIKKVYGEWLNAIVNRVKESTYANYTMKFEKHILPYFGEMLCTSINSAKINDFIKTKMDSGLSAGYVRDLFTVLKALMQPHERALLNTMKQLKSLYKIKFDSKEDIVRQAGNIHQVTDTV